MKADTIPEARKVVESLEEGDKIKVGQYKGVLEVTHCGGLQGDKNAFVGLEFVNKSGAEKTMVTNQHSKRVWLSAGTTDKGEVTDIQKL